MTAPFTDDKRLARYPNRQSPHRRRNPTTLRTDRRNTSEKHDAVLGLFFGWKRAGGNDASSALAARRPDVSGCGLGRGVCVSTLLERQKAGLVADRLEARRRSLVALEMEIEECDHRLRDLWLPRWVHVDLEMGTTLDGEEVLR